MVDVGKVSVIMPVYNAQEFIDKAIQSVLNQTYQNLEIILIDDGSVDMSLEICQRYAAIDSRIIVVHQRNMGVSQARNKGLEIATGDYIGFVDSDDWIESTMYEKMLQRMHLESSDMTICGHNTVHGSTITAYSCDDSILDSEKALTLLIEDRIIRNQLWSLLCKRRLYNNIKFEVGKIYEDVRVIFKLFIAADQISIISDCLYNYVIRQNSLSHNFDPQQAMDLFVALQIQKEGVTSVFPQLSTKCAHREYEYCKYILREFAKNNISMSDAEVKSVYSYMRDDYCELYGHKVIWNLVKWKYKIVYLFRFCLYKLKYSISSRKV